MITSSQISTAIGGVWEYKEPDMWYCDDGRTILRVSSDLDGIRSLDCYWLYGSGTPKPMHMELTNG